MQARVMDIPGMEYPTDAMERRDGLQPAERSMGQVIACDGARAQIAACATSLVGTRTDFWSIGKLISINLGSTRIVGLVCDMTAADGVWDEARQNQMRVTVELVGEIVDRPGDGAPEFRRGITNYPFLGALAHRIRLADLVAVYDLGGRNAIEVGWLSQDATIPATVSVNDMLRCHFAVVGTTGVGKSSAVSLLLREAVRVKPNLRVLVLDPHNEYAHAFRGISITLDSSTLELPYWMFTFEEFSEVIFRGRDSVQEELDILREIIATAKGRYKVSAEVMQTSTIIRKPLDVSGFTADTPVPYRLLTCSRSSTNISASSSRATGGFTCARCAHGWRTCSATSATSSCSASRR